MNKLVLSLRQTLGSLRMVGLIYGVTLVLGLLAALPFYNTLIVEDQDSPAFLNLLNGFDYTVYSDFMHRSGPTVRPLLSVGRWLGILYVFLSVFFAGGILGNFAQLRNESSPDRFIVSNFWQGCSQYAGRFLKLFGVTLLFILFGAVIWLIAGSLVTVALSDTFTERGLFWTGLAFFGLFGLTATLIFCIGDYAKVLMVLDDERRAFRAFGRAGRLVVRNVGKTYGRYWLLIGIGAGLFGLYFLIDEVVLMSGWLTILLMLVVQQALIFTRVGLKVWSLALACTVYETLPKPAPVVRQSLSESLPPAEPPIHEHPEDVDNTRTV